MKIIIAMLVLTGLVCGTDATGQCVGGRCVMRSRMHVHAIHVAEPTCAAVVQEPSCAAPVATGSSCGGMTTIRHHEVSRGRAGILHGRLMRGLLRGCH